MKEEKNIEQERSGKRDGRHGNPFPNGELESTSSSTRRKNGNQDNLNSRAIPLLIGSLVCEPSLFCVS